VRRYTQITKALELTLSLLLSFSSSPCREEASLETNLRACNAPCGALAMYLFYRIDFFSEMQCPPDCTGKRSWFLIKLLIPGDPSAVEAEPEDEVSAEQVQKPTSGPRICSNNTFAMPIRTFAEAMKGALLAVGLVACFLAHFGRKAGSVILEMAEIPKSVIEAMGNWNLNQHQLAYSTWLPLLPMRALILSIGSPLVVFSHFVEVCICRFGIVFDKMREQLKLCLR